MICDECKTDSAGCPECGRRMTVKSDGTMRVHKRDVVRYSGRCPASGRLGPIVHPGCKGCTCQHKPTGSWKGGVE
jgi:hypothetical protein